MGHLGQEGWQEAVPTGGGVLVRLGADPSGHLKLFSGLQLPFLHLPGT